MPMKPLAGVFLALACLLGIAATGSVFELAYGDPDLGVSTTRLILGLALPGTVLSLLVVPAVYGLIGRFTGSPERRAQVLREQLGHEGA